MVGLVIDATGKPDIGIYTLAALVGAGAIAFLFLKEIGDGTAANSSKSRVTT